MRTFQIVEYKVDETAFFLRKIEETTYDLDFAAARYYLSAFLASSRSITFAIQASISKLPNFDKWYAGHQIVLKNNKLARFFLEARNSSQKIGYYPIFGGRMANNSNGRLRMELLFDTLGVGETIDNIPEEDVLTSCESYFKLLLEIVLDCYKEFGTFIDPDQYYTLENITNLGKTVEDIEEELGFPRGWTKVGFPSDRERITALKGNYFEGIDPILVKYLGINRFGIPLK